MSTTPNPDLQVLSERRGRLGLITLNRAPALNALSLGMIRELTRLLRQWENDDHIDAVLVQGAARPGKAPAFCAGGDIRFFHQAALAGDSKLEDFFTEEYALNHLIHDYPKPYIAWMDGICMGGGMGISQGASHRVVTEHSKLAMPETHIGLFPDVGGGWFLSRCAGHLGEYLALTGHVLKAADAIACGLADIELPSAALPDVIEALAAMPWLTPQSISDALRQRAATASAGSLAAQRPDIDRHFAGASIHAIEQSLVADACEWAQATLTALHKQSPLMMAVTLEQVRRARSMTLAEDLRMERDLVRHCFQLRPGLASETVEGIRALAVDKDHSPRWSPANIAEVTTEMVAPFFDSPWPAWAHPLAHLR
ncbi:enoyl-CoA hydratase/isomerase family protein [Ideonella sp. DXS29W]|uniref:Enoyl-CoA hydratase/isomerase family protein n=1 Tax=Ideonella lacteola TaxID=2984193 RepID=A0ABU9BVT8_9BURK